MRKTNAVIRHTRPNRSLLMSFHKETLIAGAFSLFGGSQANKQRRREAARNREFQRMMSSTAYQRQTRDLEAAGLNRILGYTKGGPATTPGGAMAQQQDIITPAVSTALQTRRLQQELKNLLATETKETQLGISAEAQAEMAKIELANKKKIFGGDKGDLFRAYEVLGPIGGAAYGLSTTTGAKTIPLLQQKQYKLRKLKQRKGKGSATPIPRKY